MLVKQYRENVNIGEVAIGETRVKYGWIHLYA